MLSAWTGPFSSFHFHNFLFSPSFLVWFVYMCTSTSLDHHQQRFYPTYNICVCFYKYHTQEIFGGEKNWRIMSYLPKFSSPIFTDTLKMYLAYALTVAYSQIFPHPNSFYLYGSPKFSHVWYKLCVKGSSSHDIMWSYRIEGEVASDTLVRVDHHHSGGDSDSTGSSQEYSQDTLIIRSMEHVVC